MLWLTVLILQILRQVTQIGFVIVDVRVDQGAHDVHEVRDDREVVADHVRVDHAVDLVDTEMFYIVL